MFKRCHWVHLLRACLFSGLAMTAAPLLAAGGNAVVAGELPAVLDAQQLEVKGDAYDRETGELLYSEYHFCSTANASMCKVEYRDIFGSLIAVKSLDYTTGKHSPSLVMRDFRTKRDVVVEKEDEQNLVVDAGFDNFVRSRWQDLTDGKWVKFPFLVAGFDRALPMKARQDLREGCPAHELCLKIALDSFLLGMLANPIELNYSREGRKLLTFAGTSNIKSDKGKSQNVEIHYHYADDILFVGPSGRTPGVEYQL